MMDLFNRGLLENELMTNAWDNQAFLDSSPEGSVGAPSGVQPTPPNPQANKDPVRSLLGLGSFLPGIGGDLLGPIADLRAMQQDPDKRTLANLALFGVGALPVIPSMVWMMNRKVANPIQKGIFSNQSGALGYHGTNVTSFDNNEFNPLSHFGSRPQAAEDRIGVNPQAVHSFLSGGSPYLKNTHIRKVDLDIKNPLRIEDFGGSHKPIHFAREALRKGVLTDKEFEALRIIAHHDDSLDDDLVAKALIKNLRGKGYDGFVYTNKAEDAGQDSYVIFDKSQVHSGLGKRESAFGDIPKASKILQKKYFAYDLDEETFKPIYFETKKELMQFLYKMNKTNPNSNYEWEYEGGGR